MTFGDHPILGARFDHLGSKKDKTELEQLEFLYLGKIMMVLDVIGSLENGARGFHSYDVAMVEAYAKDLMEMAAKSKAKLKGMENVQGKSE